MDVDMEDYEGVPLRDSPVWRDISPVYLQDTSGVVAIQYSLEHGEALAYFRAIMAKQEYSPRALQLTSLLIEFNSADYTAWKYRWQCLQTLDATFDEEYKMTEDIMNDNAKNYQLWNHRRLCARKLGPAYIERELEFAKQALGIDDKNYHAWAHRQAVADNNEDVWLKELAYATELLETDTRNNSAWNQRFRTLQKIAKKANINKLISEELEFVLQHVRKAPRNESPWNYLLGLFTLPGCRLNELGRQKRVYAICSEALGLCMQCAPALDVLSEYYRCLAQVFAEKGPLYRRLAESALLKAVQTLQTLLIVDPVRKPYWQQRQAVMQKLLEQIAN